MVWYIDRQQLYFQEEVKPFRYKFEEEDVPVYGAKN